jgi:isocitrate dehydrogenase
MTSHITVPPGGSKIVPGQATPDNPIIPFIEGDGIGIDITPVMIKVIDAAVAKAYGGAKKFTGWRFLPAKNLPASMGRMSGFPRKPSMR